MRRFRAAYAKYFSKNRLPRRHRRNAPSLNCRLRKNGRHERALYFPYCFLRHMGSGNFHGVSSTLYRPRAAFLDLPGPVSLMNRTHICWPAIPICSAARHALLQVSGERSGFRLEVFSTSVGCRAVVGASSQAIGTKRRTALNGSAYACALYAHFHHRY